jgi:hypothetical protein
VSGRLIDIDGITVVPLEWPGRRRTRPSATKGGRGATSSVVEQTLVVRRLTGRRPRPLLIISHAPPRAASGTRRIPITSGMPPTGGCSTGTTRRSGCTGTRRWPPSRNWRVIAGPSTVCNVTGSILVELLPPDVAAAAPA